MDGIDGKVALITGSGSGIGRQTARLFAKSGAKVCVADWSEEGGQETVAQIVAAGGEATFVKTDVSNEVMVESMVTHCVATLGAMDFAFNNAGIDQPGRSTTPDVSAEEYDRVLAINLKGVFLCMKYELKHMLSVASGSIVNTSSGAGIKGVPRMGAYCAAKHGVVGLTKAAALDHARDGVRINAICPGLIHTHLLDEQFAAAPELKDMYIGMQPMGRMGEPEEVGELVLWLCSENARYMNGAIVTIDGGYAAS